MEKTCFVMMPFGSGNEYKGKEKESNFILKSIIEPAVKDAIKEFVRLHPDKSDFSLKVIRELENVAPGNITESIIRHIASADITIVDLTGRNPNVFLELGVRFALKRNGTILLIQEVADMPFNIKAYRTVEYNPLYDGAAKGVEALKATIVQTLETLSDLAPVTTDSLVFQSLEGLNVFFREKASLSDQIDWADYWGRISHITDELSELFAAGAYKPDILVGISNGGLLLADSVLRIVYSNSLPLICLWAFRSQEKFFANPVNNALVTSDVINNLLGKRDEQSKSERIRILVMDDIVGTQRTFMQLVEYFKTQLGGLFEKIEIRFVFVYTPRQETLHNLEKYLLSNDREIVERHQRVVLETVTHASELPYRKSIHYGDVIRVHPNASDLSKND